MNKTHTVSTDDFEDFAPEVTLAGCHNEDTNKVLVAEISFGEDIHSGRNVAKAMFVVKNRRSDEKPFVTEFLDEAIAKYNEIR